jgi:Zn-dependent protease
MGYLASMLLGLPGFALGIMIHESAHAFAAYKLGDPTARNMGRISLDPRKHIDLFGAIAYVVTSYAMYLAGRRGGFGWAKPVIINPYNFRDWRRDFMLSSLAGPVANLAQAVVWALLLRGYLAIARVVPEPVQSSIGLIIILGIQINVLLAIFNLIPIPPLDGSRLLAWALPERYARYVDQMEQTNVGMAILVGVFLFVPGLLTAVFVVFGGPLLRVLMQIAGLPSP